MILNEPFNKGSLNSLLKDFLPDYRLDEREVRTSDGSVLTRVTQLGVSHSRELDVTVLEAECEEADTGKRIAITQAAFKVLRDHQIRNAIVAFHDSNDQWRLSLLTSTLEFDKAGKIISKASNPRRYSYLLGVGAKTITPYKYLIKQGRVNSLEQLQKRFSVEVVNNDFYSRIATIYDELVGTDKVRASISYPGGGDTVYEFAVRLIGRIMFCWFLREKRSVGGKPLISQDLVSLDAAKAQDFYNSILAPLFFEVLNRPRSTRVSDRFKAGSFGEVPYLNGGLFAQQDGDFYHYDRELDIAVSREGLRVPDEWLQKLFTLLEEYNFTVDENTSIDIELSIDPEMLGRIFENLLARINPETGTTVRNSTGSFYTPREIVGYMVDTSLFEYLLNKTGIAKQKLEALISYNLDDDVAHPLDLHEKESVVEALGTLKVFDPACGSGAYPIGMLQKIVFILKQVDPENKIWLARQLSSASTELRRELSKQSHDYVRKSEILKNSIFGVDIQPIATEISRLRCFLTLIVEESIDDSDSDNRGVRVLPNLDFKFITADTLVRAPRSTDDSPMLFDTFEDDFASAVDEYFSAEGLERANLSHKLRDLIDKKVNENIDFVLNSKGLYKDNRFVDAFNAKNATRDARLIEEANIWKSYKNIFSHQKIDFFETKYMFPSVKDGFDLVIGNPPYVSTEKIKEPVKTLYKNQFSDIHASRTDIYTYFYKRGLDLTKKDTGLLCYITSNKWMRAGYGEKTRAYFASKNPIKLIDFGGFKVFESATVDTNILLIQNATNQQNLEASHFKNDYKKDDEIASYFESTKSTLAGLSGKTWFIGSGAEQSLKAKIEQVGTPLKDWDVKINYGIKTGCNEAFIIDEATKDRLIAEDAKSTDIIKPILRGRDIKRYDYQFAGNYILTVGFGDYKTLEQNYPAVYKHLSGYEEKLKARGQCKSSRSGKQLNPDYAGQHHWLELDNNPSKEYFDEFEKEKIVWPMVSTRSVNCSLVDKGLYLNNKCFLITGQDLYYISGILNSRLAWRYFVTQESPLGDSLEIRTPGMLKYPIPKITPTNQHLADELTTLVTQIQSTTDEPEKSTLSDQIDQLVYQLYNLTPEEISIVEGL